MGQALLTRRRVLQTTVAATTLAAPFVRGAYAAGKLSIGTLGPPGSRVRARSWASSAANGPKGKRSTSPSIAHLQRRQGFVDLMAEGQAKAGHDIWACVCGTCRRQADNSRPAG